MSASDQIRQMVNFILQEAHEKANEIRVKVSDEMSTIEVELSCAFPTAATPRRQPIDRQIEREYGSLDLWRSVLYRCF